MLFSTAIVKLIDKTRHEMKMRSLLETCWQANFTVKTKTTALMQEPDRYQSSNQFEKAIAIKSHRGSRTKIHRQPLIS